MRPLWSLVTLMFLSGCPPPVDFDILNNTGAELVMYTLHGTIPLEPDASVQLTEREVAQRQRDPQGNATLPVLRLEHLGHRREYYLPLRVEDGWHRNWTFMVQVDPDLAIRIARPMDGRRVPVDYSQPAGWPLLAIDSVGPTAEHPRR
jgi:hypothetical protein